MIIISFHLHGVHLPGVGLPTAVHLAEPSSTNDSVTKNMKDVLWVVDDKDRLVKK